ncbi:MAG: hypothetical protein M1823_002339 [Watsoniomyces obsoletus]|nr:MAG: hypothetical protein M1823_002339 [Watsoniomyces obsoletus]
MAEPAEMSAPPDTINIPAAPPAIAATATLPGHAPAQPTMATRPMEPKSTTRPMDTIVSAAARAASLDAPNQPKRPRDARLMHIILAMAGINAYEERVPLQLLDFAYRYTLGMLQDAIHFNHPGSTKTGTGNAGTTSGGGTTTAAAALTTTNTNQADGASNLTSRAVMSGVVTRSAAFQVNKRVPKEILLEMARKRNKVALRDAGDDWGARLPHERYCLMDVGWGLKEEWESEEEIDDDVGGDEMEGVERERGNMGGEERQQQQNGDRDEGDEEEEDERDEKMEDIFGEGGDDGDDEMQTDG